MQEQLTRTGLNSAFWSIRVERTTLIALCIVLFATVFGLFSEDASIGFLAAVMQLALIFTCAKLSLFSIFPALVTFCLFQELAALSGWEVYGLLGVGGVPLYFDELKVCTYALNLIVLYFLLFTNCLENERALLGAKFEISPEVSSALLFMALCITLLIFPSLPSLSAFSSGRRFDQGILPFAGWSIIPFFLLSVALGSVKHRRMTMGAIAFVVVWYAFHGERVEALGFIALLVIKYYCDNRGVSGTAFKIAIFSLIIIPIFVSIGSLRSGSSLLGLEDLVRSILVQSTACDVTYVFNCAVDLFYRGLRLNGTTYLSYLINCIPLLEDPYSFNKAIMEYYYTAGGGLFFAEPIANFGFLFSIPFTAVFFSLIVWIISRKSKYAYLVYCTLVIAIFRLAWYGLNYPIVTIVYFVPFVLVFSKLLEPMKRESGKTLESNRVHGTQKRDADESSRHVSTTVH